MFRNYNYPMNNFNQRGLLLPFVGGALLGGLGGYFIANSQPGYPVYYPPYPMPYGTYQNPIPYQSNGYYPY